MRRQPWLSVLFLILLGACASAGPASVPSLPPVPEAASGWSSLGSVGRGSAGPGFVGIRMDVAGRPLALNVTCVGTGTLVVTISRGEGTPLSPGEDAVVFPCSASSSATMRHELFGAVEAGSLTVSGAVIEGAGALQPTVFQISLEQAAA